MQPTSLLPLTQPGRGMSPDAARRARALAPGLQPRSPGAFGPALLRDVPHQVPMSELFTAGFVARHTPYPNLHQLLEAGGVSAVTLTRLDGQPLHDWDVFIRASTRHAGWHAMLREAGAEWLVRRMGLIVDA